MTPVEDAKEAAVKLWLRIVPKESVIELNTVVIQEQATNAAFELYASVQLSDHLLKIDLDDTGARVGIELVVVVLEGSLIGISSKYINLMIHDGLVEDLEGIMDLAHLGRCIYVVDVEDSNTNLCQAGTGDRHLERDRVSAAEVDAPDAKTAAEVGVGIKTFNAKTAIFLKALDHDCKMIVRTLVIGDCVFGNIVLKTIQT